MNISQSEKNLNEDDLLESQAIALSKSARVPEPDENDSFIQLQSEGEENTSDLLEQSENSEIEKRVAQKPKPKIRKY